MASTPSMRRGRTGRTFAHPDHDLLWEARDAIEWWASEQPRWPTSSLTGGGAIEAVEDSLSNLLDGRPVLALPNATFAMLVALQAAGVRAGDEVLVTGADWPAARAGARLLGARPVPMPLALSDLSVDVEAAAALVSHRTKAAVVTHLHGLVAEVPRLRFALPKHVKIIEDCAQALKASRDGQPAGTFGDYGVFSLGPDKAVSAGELGLLATSSWEGHRAAVAVSQHPTRQLLAGVPSPRADVLIGRAPPLIAVLAAYKLRLSHAVTQELVAADADVRAVLARTGAKTLGSALQHPQPGCIPIAVDCDECETAIRQELTTRRGHHLGISISPSGACVDPDLAAKERERLTSALDRIRVVSVRFPPDHNRR